MLEAVVVGFGPNGQNHLGELLSFKEIKVIGVCRKNKDKVLEAEESIKKKFNQNIPVETDYKKLISKLSEGYIANICTSDENDNHYHIAKYALGHGAHVMIEKPMTTKVEHAQELEEIARQNKKYIMVGSQLYNIQPHIQDQLQKTSEKIEVKMKFNGLNKPLIGNTLSQAVALIPSKYDLIEFTEAYYVNDDKNHAIAKGIITINGKKKEIIFEMQHFITEGAKEISISFDDKKYDMSTGKPINGVYHTILKLPDGTTKPVFDMRRTMYEQLFKALQQKQYNGPFVLKSENGVRNQKYIVAVEKLLQHPPPAK